MAADTPSPATDAAPSGVPERPPYEPPRIQAMSERDILKTFQITQSMVSWWTSGACC